MQYVNLRLSDSKDHKEIFDLKFRLLDHKFVDKWVGCVLQAQQKQYPISEPWAMYNLNDSMNAEFIKNNLNRLIKQIDSVEKLFGVQLDNIDDQDTLNKIHAVFEKHHGQLDQWKTNPLFENKPDSFRKNFSEINQLIHACEGINGKPKIRVVWFDLPKDKLFSDEDYNLFTTKRSFGSMYHLYCEVGKGVESLAVDDDDHHHDLVPNLHYSADCVVYFQDDTEQEVNDVEQKYKQYLKDNAEYIQSQGYDLDSKQLTTGRIELARLEMDGYSEKDIMDKIKNFDTIQSLFIY